MDWTYWQNIANDQQTQRNNNLRDQETAAEQAANTRQGYITDETNNINNQFDSTFTPDFYNNYAKSLTDYWRPDIDQQYGDAQKQINYDFATTQPGGGSAGAYALGRLKQADDNAVLTANDNAQSQAKQLQGSVEARRSSLLGELNSSTDPNAVGATVAPSIGSIPVTPAYSPVGDIFSNITGQFAVAQQARNQNLPGWGFGANPGNAAGGNGSMQEFN
jgi:hypothetical protein